MTRSVTVRMYDAGLGDCFVVRFRDGDSERRVLVDCGTHPASTSKRPFPHVVEAVQADLLASGGDRHVDVVVASNRHRDHIAGFEHGGWDAIAAGEIWMPWTEDPDDPTARAVSRAHSAAVVGFSELAGDAAATHPVRAMLANSEGTDKAMATLHGGFRGVVRRRFLGVDGEGGAPGRVTIDDAIPGVRAHVLGPWVDDVAVADMTPPAAAKYVAGSDQRALLAERDDALPFAPWRMSLAEYEARFPRLHDLAGSHLGAVVFGARLPAIDVVASVEQSGNASSLVAAFEFGSALLLFAGDGQRLTWDRALQNPATRKLLARTSVYKVAHHGAHNATPADLVEHVFARPYAAMVPVGDTAVDEWRDLPSAALLAQLRGCGMIVVRSDAPEEHPGVRVGDGGLWTEITLPA